ncbi:MAG: DNA-binding beta-propeller fold protein YncE, partial [Myxococcota bacterium]
MYRLNLVPLLLAAACGTDAEPTTTGSPASSYRGQLVDTLLMGPADNAEVVRVVPNTDRAVLVSSKARKLTLLQASETGLTSLREAVLLAGDPGESELTSIAISPDGTWAAVTRTILTFDEQGAQTRCGGEVLLVDVTDGSAFGSVLATVSVGPMPDSVDIAPNGQVLAVGNERDGPDAWGKCDVLGAEASISVVDVTGGPAAAVEIYRIRMIDTDTGPREPESVCFGADSDLVAVTLQDSHELALFRVSALSAGGGATSADLQIVALPVNALGAGPWPDGVTRFADGTGRELFAIAGEWNDTFTLVDTQGTVVASVSLDPADLPDSLPRVLAAGSPRFSPDSIAAFVREGRSYLGFTLRHSGAVGVWDVTDPAKIHFAGAIAVGKNEQGGSDEDGSTIRPEGISASPDGSWIIVANEGE